MAYPLGFPSRNIGAGIRYAPARGYNPAAYVPGGSTWLQGQSIQNQGFGQPTYVPQGTYNPAAYVPGGASPAVAQAIQSQGFGTPHTIPTSGASGVTPLARSLQGVQPSQTASQVANQRAQAQLNPQIAAQNQFNARQNAAIQGFALALAGKMQPFAGQIAGQYDTAIGQQAALAGQSAQFLQNANPSPDVQALLQSVNAPASQQAQVGQQLTDTFGGGGAVLNYLGGQVPAQELLSDKTAAVGQAGQYPLLAGLQGGQDLSIALGQQTDARNQLLATRPALYQAALQDIRTNQANKAQLAQGAANLTETKREFNITAAPKIAAQKFVNWYQTTGHNLTPAQVDAAALRFGVITPGTTSTSKNYAVANTKNGSYVINNTTGVAKLIPGTDAGSSGTWTAHDTKTGSIIVNSKTGAVEPIPGTTPGAKTYPSKTVNTPAGTIIFNPNDNSWSAPIPGTAPVAKVQKPTVYGSAKGGYNALVPDGKGGWQSINVRAPDPTVTTQKPFTWSYKGRGYRFDPATGITMGLGGAPPSAAKPGGLTPGEGESIMTHVQSTIKDAGTPTGGHYYQGKLVAGSQTAAKTYQEVRQQIISMIPPGRKDLLQRAINALNSNPNYEPGENNRPYDTIQQALPNIQQNVADTIKAGNPASAAYQTALQTGVFPPKLRKALVYEINKLYTQDYFKQNPKATSLPANVLVTGSGT